MKKTTFQDDKEVINKQPPCAQGAPSADTSGSVYGDAWAVYARGVLLGFVLFNVVWYACSFGMQMDALPMPHKVYAGWHKALAQGIWGHVGVSVTRVFMGLGLGLFIGLAVGVPLGYSPALNRTLGPLLYFSYPIPKLALLPVVMVLLGIGELSKITIIVLIIVFQLIISIRDSIRSIPAENYALLTSLGASTGEKLRHITLPAILPAVLSSLRVSIGMALSALFFTETYGTIKGLGFYITDCWMRLDYVQMYFGLFVLAMTGFLLFLVLDLAERLLCRWRFLSYP